MGISINGPSGIDTSYIIDSLVGIEAAKVDAVQRQIDTYHSKIDAYSKLESYLSDIESAANKLQTEDNFNVFETTTSNEDVVNFEAGIGGVEGSYAIEVFQMANREKLISTNDLITSQTSKLSDLGITSGIFSVNGTQITLNDNDTIQDLRLKINNATDVAGDSIGVTATVLKISDSNFRMILTADDTGDDGVEYADIGSDSVLQQLGFILDASGNKGIYSHTLKSDNDINASFNALNDGEAITYSAKDHLGNDITGTFIKNSGDTIDNFVDYVSDMFHGMVNVSVDGTSGQLTIADNIGGLSELAINSFSIGGGAETFTTTEIGRVSRSVLSSGSDSFFSIDSIGMRSDTNSVSGNISGVTLQLDGTTNGEIINIEMKRDLGKITENFNELIKNYNALYRYVNESTRYKNGDSGIEKGVLSGDSSTRTILNQIRSVFRQQFDVTGDNQYGRMTMIGLETDSNSGEFKLDTGLFEEKLTENFDDVMALFITRGFSSNSNVGIGRFDDDTEEGVYELIEADGVHYEARRILPVIGSWYGSMTRNGEIIDWSDGPLKGLSITASVGSGDTTFTFQKGLVGHLQKLIDKMSDSYDGTVAMRTESWNKSIGRLEDRKIDAEMHVETYRMRLVKEFSAMEQTLNMMQMQSSSMMSQLGYNY